MQCLDAAPCQSYLANQPRSLPRGRGSAGVVYARCQEGENPNVVNVTASNIVIRERVLQLPLCSGVPKRGAGYYFKPTNCSRLP